MREIVKALCLMIPLQKASKTLSSDYFDHIPKINIEEQVQEFALNLIN